MIPQFEPWIGDEELAQVTEVLRSNWITEGEKNTLFQQKIAEIVGVKHCLTICNGTLALYVAMAVLGIGPGDEVIVPDFTFIASANSVVLAGARPVFADVDARTFNLDPESARRAITPRTKAVMPVHIYGQSADIEAICQIAAEHGLFVVEDAAQGICVSFNGKPVGSFGHINAMSFFADKTMTTGGEGGAVLTNDDELADRALFLKNQGRLERGRYIHPHLGFNFRITDLQAAVGLGQLAKLGMLVQRKARNESLYRECLGGVDGVELPYVDPRGVPVPFRIVILVDDPESLSQFLEREGVGSRRVFYPLHRQPYYAVDGEFPNADRAYARGIALPSSARLAEEEIIYICDRIKDFVAGHRRAAGSRE